MSPMKREKGAQHMQVAFPAEMAFTAVGRVAVSGLALRLGFDIGLVEQLRLAVDASTAALCNDGLGQVEVDTEWSGDSLVIALENEAVSLDGDEIETLRSRLAELVPDPLVTDHLVVLRLGDQATS